MARIALTNFRGAWFDNEKATKISEKSFYNGSKYISCATGSQTEHEAMYITPSGKFILNHWSDFQGVRESYEHISKEKAAEWFAKQAFSNDEIPELLREEVNSYEIE